MKRTTQWSPDTCGCILEYEWDDAQNENTRTHTFKKIVKLCERHKMLSGTKAYDQLMSENTRKNRVLGEAQKVYSSITPEDYTWSFDANNKLKVSFSGKLKAKDKSRLQIFCDDEFGGDKTEVI